MAQTELTWYGQSGFKIVTPGGKTLLIDPWLTNPVFEKALKKRGVTSELRVMKVGETITVGARNQKD